MEDNSEITMVQSDCNQNDTTGTYDNEIVYPVTDSNLFNSAGPGFEYYPQAGIVEEDTSCHGNWTWFDQRVLASGTIYTQSIVRVYIDKNLHSHTAVLSNNGDHEVVQIVYTCKGSSLNQAIRSPNCTMSVTNFSCFYDGNWVPIVYLPGRDGLHLTGFYLWNQNSWGGDSSLITYGHLPEGMLTIINTVLLCVVPVGPTGLGLDLGSNPDPGLVYCKDCRRVQYYGCSYVKYMVNIIDNLIGGAESAILRSEPPASGMDVSPICNEQRHEKISLDACGTSIAYTEHDIRLVQQPNWRSNNESN